MVSATFLTAGGGSSAPTCLAASPRDSAAAGLFFRRVAFFFSAIRVSARRRTRPRDQGGDQSWGRKIHTRFVDGATGAVYFPCACSHRGRPTPCRHLDAVAG